MAQKEAQLRDAVVALTIVLDPHQQGDCWPDPIAWDGRPLADQARDLLAMAAEYLTDPGVFAAAEALRAIVRSSEAAR